MTNNSPMPSKDPKATFNSPFIKDVMKAIANGEFALPEIQRKYVWTANEQKKLLESIFNGYDISRILAYKLPVNPPFLHSRAITGSNSPLSPAHAKYLIIDGQQRLTTLFHLYDGQINFFFNVMTGTFSTAKEKKDATTSKVTLVSQRNSPYDFLVHEVLHSKSPQRFMKQFATKSSFELITIRANFNLLRERLKETRLLFSELHNHTFASMAENYVVTNQAGRSVKSPEIAMAYLSPQCPGIINKVMDAQDRILAPKFPSQAKNELFVRVMAAYLTGHNMDDKKNGLYNLGTMFSNSVSAQQGIQDAAYVAEHGVVQAIKFFKDCFGVEDERYIVKENWHLMLIVALYLGRLELAKRDGKKTTGLSQSNSKQIVALEFYVKWGLLTRLNAQRGQQAFLDDQIQIATGEFGNQKINDLDIPTHLQDYVMEKFKTLHNLAKGFSLKNYFDVTTMEDLNDNNYGAAIVALDSIRANNAGERHLWSNKIVKLDLSKGNVDIHHIFPKAYMVQTQATKTRKLEDLAYGIDHPANKVALDATDNKKIGSSVPASYLFDLGYNKDEKVVKGYHFPSHDSKWFEYDNYETFIEERSALIAAKLNSYMNV